jgi:hypothetical protein
MESIILDKARLERIENIFEENTKEIRIPELNPINGFLPIDEKRKKEIEYNSLKDKECEYAENLKKEIDDFKVVVVKVKQLDLPNYINIRNDINNYINNLIDGVVSAAAISDDAVKDETLQALKKMSPEAQYRLWVVKKGVVEPKLGTIDCLRLSKLFPVIILRLYDAIIKLTEKGGSLKKNTKTT